MDFLTSPAFWVALGQIIIIDILLGGDNAVVIALACRKLPPAQRTKGIIWGTAGAIVLRVILIAFAMTLLNLPFLKLVGAILLVGADTPSTINRAHYGGYRGEFWEPTGLPGPCDCRCGSCWQRSWGCAWSRS